MFLTKPFPAFQGKSLLKRNPAYQLAGSSPLIITALHDMNLIRLRYWERSFIGSGYGSQSPTKELFWNYCSVENH